jgi:hypothetical protein
LQRGQLIAEVLIGQPGPEICLDWPKPRKPTRGLAWVPGFFDNSKKVYLTVYWGEISYLLEDFLFIERNED